MNPKERSLRDIHGGMLFIHETWKECVSRCDGRVIFVSCLDHIKFGSDGDREVGLFENNGVVVDLFSDPLGWDDEGESDSCGENVGVKTIKGHVSKMKSISSSIHKAAEYIQKSREKDRSGYGADGNGCFKPTPIIFDSVTTILLHHGVEKLTVLLTHLKQNEGNRIRGRYNSALSPIFLPCLVETLSSSCHQILEDYADAVMTLNGGRVSIAKRSARSGGMVCGGLSGGVRLIKDIQLFDIDDGRLKLKTKNGNQCRRQNDKEDGSDNHKKEVSKGGPTNDTAITRLANQSNEVEQISSQTRGLRLDESSEKRPNRGHQRPVLKHQSDEQPRKKDLTESLQASTTSINKPAPRIFMEENDPEFDDFDEEDPDDDLDI